MTPQHIKANAPEGLRITMLMHMARFFILKVKWSGWIHGGLSHLELALN